MTQMKFRMKFHIKSIILISAAVFASQAWANGVEKRILPVDARNVRLLKLDVVYVPTAYLPPAAPAMVSDEGGMEGTPQAGAPVLAPRLQATFAYDSNNPAVQPENGTGMDGELMSWDDTRPTFSVAFDAPAAVLNAVRSGGAKPSDLIRYSVSQQEVRIAQPLQYRCEYNLEYNTQVDPACAEPAPTYLSEERPVASVQLVD